MKTGDLNVQGDLFCGTWQLIEDKQITSSIGHDSYVKLCSHFDGADAATAYTDPIAGAATFGGTAQLDDAQKMFSSGTSLLLDGNSDYVTYPDSTSWDFGTGDFTIEFCIRFASLPASSAWMVPIGQFEVSKDWYIGLNNNSGVYSWIVDDWGASGTIISRTTTVTTNTWYRIALVRSGNSFMLFQNGVMLGAAVTYTDTFAKGAPTVVLTIGRYFTSGYVDGWIDEVRISKGIARWTSDYSASLPTIAYGTTSYTFSGLAGNTDEEYRIVSKLVSGCTAAGALYCRLNNDSGTNYGREVLYGLDTTCAAYRATNLTGMLQSGFGAIGENSFSDCHIRAKSGLVRTGIVKIVQGIVATTVVVAATQGMSWSNTADEVTSLVLATDVTDGIGAGSRLLLFRRTLSGATATTGSRAGTLNVKGDCNAGVMQKIYDNTLAGAATSVAISGLNGDTDILYELTTRVIGGSTPPVISVKINTDTGANYGYQNVRGENSTASALRSVGNNMTIGSHAASGDYSFSNTLIFSPSGYIRAGLIMYVGETATTTVGNLNLRGCCWNNTADNITALTVQADQTNGLGVGTHIELWALRKRS